MSVKEARELAALIAWQRPDLDMCGGGVWPHEPSGLILWDAQRQQHIVIRSVDDWREYQTAAAAVGESEATR